ncbi:MAG: 30S ribosome-binding factor RbfA [Planctomycetes bacterium]|nr:30S ribosome-binding factor RbfA [Planctomycetota bacterium]
MSSRRIAKVAEALRETISTTVLFGIRDPRVKNVTVLRTEVSPDLKSARVFVSVMGDETAQSLAMHGLRSARGFIQSQIAEKLELRYTPILSFVLDQGIKRSIEASAIIRNALADSVTSPAEEGTTGDAEGEPTTGDPSVEEGADSTILADTSAGRDRQRVPGCDGNQTTESMEIDG